MNTFNAQMVNGEMVINFVGEIGTYWKDGKESFNTNGMTLAEIDTKVNQIVGANKVITETPLTNGYGIEPTYLTYLISSEKLANVIKKFIKSKTDVDAEIAVGYDVGTFHPLLIFNEKWLIDLSKPVYDKLQAGLWDGFDVDEKEENMAGVLSMIFGVEKDHYAETFNFKNKNGVFDVEINIPYEKPIQSDSEIFITVYSEGGIINDCILRTNLEDSIVSMSLWLYEAGFDYEADDARIFNAKQEEVYSFPHEFYERCSEKGIDHESYAKLAVMLWKGEIGEDDDLDEVMEKLLDNNLDALVEDLKEDLNK